MEVLKLLGNKFMKKIILILTSLVSVTSAISQGVTIGQWDFEQNSNGWEFVNLGDGDRTFSVGINSSFNSTNFTVPQNSGSTKVLGFNDEVFGDDDLLTDVYAVTAFADYSMYDSVAIFFDYYNSAQSSFSASIYVNTGGDFDNIDVAEFLAIYPTVNWKSVYYMFRPEDFDAGYFENMSIGFNYFDENSLTLGFCVDNVKIIGYKSSPNETCASAITITSQETCSESTVTYGNLSGATISSNSNDCLEEDAATVWYKFVAEDTKVNFSAKALQFYDLDLVAGVYESGCDEANFMYCINEDNIAAGGTGEEQAVLVDLVIGETYYIQLSNLTGGSLMGDYSICLSEYDPCHAPTITASATNACEGGTITLSASGIEALAWYNGEEAITDAINTTFTATESGAYKVKLTDAACEEVFSNVISLTFNPLDVVNNTHTICVGDTIVVGTSAYTTAGTFQDVFTNINGCDSTVNTTIIVTSMDINVVQNGVDFTATSTNGTTYSWVNCATEVEVATTLNFTATENGSYKLIVSDGTCSEESICYEVGSVSINKVDAFSFAMYPNPATDVLVIDAGSQVVDMITILDQNGRVVRSVQLNEVTPSISVNNLTEGLYFIQVTANGSTVTKKIAKQ